MTPSDVSKSVTPFEICRRVGSAHSTSIVVLFRYHRKRLSVFLPTVTSSIESQLARATNFGTIGTSLLGSSSMHSSTKPNALVVGVLIWLV